MSEPHYAIRQKPNGLWTIVDLLTGLPAASDGRDLTDLEAEDARDIADVLNRAASNRRKSPLV